MSYLVLVLILSAVTYRVSRFLILDTLIDEPRDWLIDRLERRSGLFFAKVIDLLGCPYCITIWVSAAVVAITSLVGYDMPVPVWTWLAVATGSLVLWNIVDAEEKPPV